jgi:transketolase
VINNIVPVKNIYGNTLVKLGAENRNVFVVEADLMRCSGSVPFMNLFPDRHIQVGIAEQNLVGVAAGLASMGRIPFACTFANFMSQRACDQIMMSVAYNKFNVKLVGCYAGITQEKNGGSHISLLDIAVVRCLPNIKVFAPGSCSELEQALTLVARDKGPAYFHLEKSLVHSLPDNKESFEIGRGYSFGKGKDITLITTGFTTAVALDAFSVLEKENIKPRLIHMPTLKPADTDLVTRCARDTGAIITIENHSVHGGLGGLVSEIVTENYPVPVFKIGLQDTFGITADLDYQLNYFGISKENILKNAKKILKLK